MGLKQIKLMIRYKLTTKIAKSNRFFYGYIVLAVSSLGYFFSGPGQTYFISVFIDHYIADFNWNRSTISSLYSIATLTAGLMLFIIGKLADKYGQRRLILIVAIILGINCMWNSYISNLWMLFAGFFLGRLTGQGSMTLLPSTVIPNWFHKKRALAFSLLSLGNVIASIVVPPLNSFMIGIWDWRIVWRFWAILLWFLFVPLTYLFHYNRPQELGLEPISYKNNVKTIKDNSANSQDNHNNDNHNSIDTTKNNNNLDCIDDLTNSNKNNPIKADNSSNNSQYTDNNADNSSNNSQYYTDNNADNSSNNSHCRDNKENNDIVDNKPKSTHIYLNNYSLKDALRTRSFWGMMYCQILIPIINTGIVFHFISILGSKGIPPLTASMALSALALVSFPSTFLAGLIMDKIKSHHAASIISLLLLISLCLLLVAQSIYVALAFAVVQGVAMGFQSINNGLVWPEYYGTRNLGSIRSIAMTATVLASAIGPIPLGIAYDKFNSYNQAIILFMILPLIGIVVALLSPRPKRKVS